MTAAQRPEEKMGRQLVNGEKMGHHEGGFMLFQFEVTATVKDGKNSVLLWVNKERRVDGIPARNFDW